MPKMYELLFEAWFKAICSMAAEDKNLKPEEVRYISNAAMTCIGALYDLEKADG